MPGIDLTKTSNIDLSKPEATESGTETQTVPIAIGKPSAIETQPPDNKTTFTLPSLPIINNEETRKSGCPAGTIKIKLTIKPKT